MLKFGEKSIKSLYLGSKVINKAFLGNKLVFNKKPYYCEVEYLESTGTQYIDTGYIANQDTRIVTKHYYTKSPENNGFIYGAGVSATSRAFEMYTWTGNWNSPYNVANLTLTPPSKDYFTNGIITIDKNKNEVTITYADGKTQRNYTGYGAFTTPYTLVLFAINRSASAPTYKADCLRLYSCKIWDNDTLVRDYIPVLDLNMKPCLYDKVSGQFFYNQGSGEFQYPPVELEYIESTGTQRIDTGISPTNKTKWEIKFAFTKETTGQLMGAGHAGDYRFNIGIESGKFRFAIGSGWTTLAETKDTDIHTWVLNSENSSCSLDDITVFSTYSSNFSTTDYHIVFCNRAVGANYCSIKIYGSKIYDNDTLVRDFMPCLLNGEIGLWDKVNNVFYPNAGTGVFINGKVV